MGPAEEFVSLQRDLRAPPVSPAGDRASPSVSRPDSEPHHDAPKPIQEADIWWGACASRTLLPSFVLCGLITALAAGIALFLHFQYELDPLVLRYSVYGVALVIWLWQLLRWAHRVLTFSYRLTNHRLLLERSFFNSGRMALELRHVTNVQVMRSSLERRLGIGHVMIDAGGHSQSAMAFAGVHDPEQIASQILLAAKQARERESSRDRH